MFKRVATVNSGFVSQGLLIQLRSHHPSGCLSSELLQVVDGSYVVRAMVAVDGLTIATAMAAAPAIEQAEDQARARVMAVIGLTPLHLGEPKLADPQLVPAAARIPDMVADVMPPAVMPPPVLLPIDSSETLVAMDDDEMSPDDRASSSAKSTKSKAKSPKAKSKPEDVPPPEPMLEQIAEPMVEITGGADATDDMAIEYEFTIEGDDEPDVPSVMPSMPSEPTIDLSDAIAQIGAEIERIGWTKKQGSSYLQEAYGKRTRAELTETELLSFLQYLKALPAKIQPALSDLPF
jgi:hypothetical protein